MKKAHDPIVPTQLLDIFYTGVYFSLGRLRLELKAVFSKYIVVKYHDLRLKRPLNVSTLLKYFLFEYFWFLFICFALHLIYRIYSWINHISKIIKQYLTNHAKSAIINETECTLLHPIVCKYFAKVCSEDFIFNYFKYLNIAYLILIW